MRRQGAHRRKVARHFTIDIGEDHFSYARNQDSITAEARLDGIYVLRTSIEPGDVDTPDVVSSHKALAHVERAFRAFNTDLDIRTVRHRTEERVRAHVFLRMATICLNGARPDQCLPHRDQPPRIGLGGVTSRIIRPVTPQANGVPLVLCLGLEFFLLEFSFG